MSSRPASPRGRAGPSGPAAVPAGLWQALADARSPEAAAIAWLALMCHPALATKDDESPAVSCGLVLLRQPDADAIVPVARWPADAAAADNAHFHGIVQAALDAGAGTLLPCPDGRAHLAWPIRLEGRIEALAALELAPRAPGALPSPAVVEAAMRRLQWGCGQLEALLWQLRSSGAAEQRLRMGLVLDLLAHLMEQPRRDDALLQVASALAAFLDCERVSIGLADRVDRCRLHALSMTASFDRTSNLIRAIEAAMDETAAHRRLMVWPDAGAAAAASAAEEPNAEAPADGDAAPPQAAAHARLSAAHGCPNIASTCLWSVATTDAGPDAAPAPIGVLLAERRHADRPFHASERHLLEAIGAALGPPLGWRARAERSLPMHARDAARAVASAAFARGRLPARLAASALALGLVVAALWPTPWRVPAETRIEGSLRRVVAAPFTGYVQQVHARVGDTVTAGQVLATLDDRELKLERSRHAAAHEALQKQLREAMANDDATQMKILEAQARQELAQLALIDDQLARGALAAPFDGVVLAGDLSQNLGAAVERGQVLYEVAPLDAYRVMLEVDERHIGAVAVGQPGELTLAALPDQRWPFRVKTITPVNTAKDGRNVFTVEAELLAPGDRLRPGMEGVGKIEAGKQPRGWVWTHDLLGRARYALWSWLP